MSHNPIEVILARQLASHLAMPMFIVDPAGDLLFYNEPAEAILGRRFEEGGWMDSGEWSDTFRPVDENGEVVDSKELPVQLALTNLRPAHRRMWITNPKGKKRTIEVTAFPLVGLGNRCVGAVSIFWELPE